jgi:broad specificity phosphatase PhoE
MGEARPARPGALRADVTIYFIRHGETDWNAEARYQGQADIPMNEKGRAQAQRNGETLRQHLPSIADADFVASPLARARETMQIVRTALGLEPDRFTVEERLKEAHYGDWQGTLLADLPRLDAAGIAARTRDPFRWRPQGGESYEDLMARTVPWLACVTRDTVVVSHGGVSRVLRGHILGLDVATVPRLDVPQDRILVLRRDGIDWL